MIETLPADVASTLRDFHFDRVPFEKMRARIAAAADLDDLHRIREPITPGSPSSVHEMPEAASPEGVKLAAEGAAAIARGELGAVVLAGGMATRGDNGDQPRHPHAGGEFRVDVFRRLPRRTATGQSAASPARLLRSPHL